VSKTAAELASIGEGSSLNGATAFVTGTARGLGSALASALYARGCNVVLADIDGSTNDTTAETIDPSGARTQTLRVDVGDPASVTRSFEAALDRWGSIEILVNNAAVTNITPIWDISLEEWDRVLAVNLRSVFLMSRLAGAQMRQAGYGRIINIASLAGQAARPSGAHYAASKGGVIALTRVFANDLASSGVTVNAVAPAIVDTPMLRAIGEERIQALTAAIPVGRVCNPLEVAAVVCFLASAEAGYITGATFDINGGVLMR
jgi:3-oxoacyl-[acyl-carrier protein] reductase